MPGYPLTMRQDSAPLLTISITSHGQGELLQLLLVDISRYVQCRYEIIVTLNIPEVLQIPELGANGKIIIIQNTWAKGFGGNHNAAFAASSGNYYCVLNPDVRLSCDPFPQLIDTLNRSDLNIGVCAPRVVDSDGNQEDSARRFPSPLRIIFKALGYYNRDGDYELKDELVMAECVAGMFMLFKREIYAEYHGFDERYFLYYEDTDFCTRLHLGGLRVVLDPRVTVIHNARRSSHTKFKYLRWHVRSMIRYFASHNAIKHYITKPTGKPSRANVNLRE